MIFVSSELSNISMSGKRDCIFNIKGDFTIEIDSGDPSIIVFYRGVKMNEAPYSGFETDVIYIIDCSSKDNAEWIFDALAGQMKDGKNVIKIPSEAEAAGSYKNPYISKEIRKNEENKN